MINALTTKLEIDIMQPQDMDEAMQLAAVHRMPALVISQLYMGEAVMNRIRRRGDFKLITTIDWPRGDTYGGIKMRGTTQEAMSADGFEIMLTPGKSQIEMKNEITVLTNFIKNHLPAGREIRFVFSNSARSEVETLGMCNAFRELPAPALLRVDNNTKAQVSKASLKTHLALLDKIKLITSIPIKLSGNIDTARMIAECSQSSQGTTRFAVNLQQAKAIIADIKKQPDLRDILETPHDDTVPKVQQ